MSPATNESPESAKHNRPLICFGIVAGILVAVSAVAVVALYVANFNLLEWME